LPESNIQRQYLWKDAWRDLHNVYKPLERFVIACTVGQTCVWGPGGRVYPQTGAPHAGLPYIDLQTDIG
jgi:hypothetical protein